MWNQEQVSHSSWCLPWLESSGTRHAVADLLAFDCLRRSVRYNGEETWAISHLLVPLLPPKWTKMCFAYWVVTAFFIAESWTEKGRSITKPKSRKEIFLLLGLKPQQRTCPWGVRDSPVVLCSTRCAAPVLSMSVAGPRRPTEWTNKGCVCSCQEAGWCCATDALEWTVFSGCLSFFLIGKQEVCFPWHFPTFGITNSFH